MPNLWEESGVRPMHHRAAETRRARLCHALPSYVNRIRVLPTLDHDPFKLNRDHALASYLSVIFSENRFPLFGITL
jgi:hypothetical protein